MNSNRLDPLAMTAGTPRQTPKNDFGQVIAQSLDAGMKVGEQLLTGVISGQPMLSAAVSSVKSAITAVVPGAGVSASGGVAMPGGSSGSAMDLINAQAQLQADGQQFNAAYLKLQDDMQRESREFNTVSNIMKVRHDSAKAAINNIR